MFLYDPDPTLDTNADNNLRGTLGGYDLDILRAKLKEDGLSETAPTNPQAGNGVSDEKPVSLFTQHRLDHHKQDLDASRPQRRGREAQNDSEHVRHMRGEMHRSEHGERSVDHRGKHHSFAAEIVAAVMK